jgi:hypothetical protein
MPTTEFLNVDLDIYSKHDLQPLIERLGRKVHVLYVGRERGKYSAHLEVAKNTKTADSTLRAFCRLIEDLPKPECGIRQPFAALALVFKPAPNHTPAILQFGPQPSKRLPMCVRRLSSRSTRPKRLPRQHAKSASILLA